MAARRKDDEEPKFGIMPARTPQEREDELINYTLDLASKQIKAGTASSQVMTHFLKMASPREKLERQRLEQENEYLKSKIETLESGRRLEEVVGDALKAFKEYAGGGSEGGSDYEDPDLF